MPLALTLLCGATRFYRLDQPAGVVFDEYHFGRFTNQYTDGQFLFDIHRERWAPGGGCAREEALCAAAVGASASASLLAALLAAA